MIFYSTVHLCKPINGPGCHCPLSAITFHCSVDYCSSPDRVHSSSRHCSPVRAEHEISICSQCCSLMSVSSSGVTAYLCLKTGPDLRNAAPTFSFSFFFWGKKTKKTKHNIHRPPFSSLPPSALLFRWVGARRKG